MSATHSTFLFKVLLAVVDHTDVACVVVDKVWLVLHLTFDRFRS
jgi:hypothetical protein